jgi:nicotinamidase/pyrazinamidase
VIVIDGREQVLWPPHCVEGTDNANVLVDGSLLHAVVRKGSRRLFDSYSGFHDDGGHPTGLHDLLQRQGVERLIIFGIATDYCVRATAMDAVALEFEAVVPTSLCRGVAPDTTEEALRAMASAGVTIVEDLDVDAL